MKSQQLKFIQNNNPMTDDIHTGIRTIKDIKTFKESLLDPESLVYPDFTRKMAEEALKNNKITIYSSKQLDTNKAQFVTPSKMQAKDYAGSNKVYSKVVDLDEVAWINSDEGQLIGKLTPKQVAPKKSDSLISKNPLYEEAKKYRSADDMIKGLEKEGKILYHGTNAKFDVFNKSKYGTYGEGVYLTPDKAKGSYYADLRAEKGGKPELIKASLGGELKIFDNVKEYNNYAKQKLNFNDKRGVVEDVERLNKDIIADGYIGVEIRKAGDKGDLHEVVVFNPKNIKTEAQLRKIWEEANKGVPKKSSLPTKKK